MKNSFARDMSKLDEDDLSESLLEALYTQDSELFKYIFHIEQELRNFESSISTNIRFGPLTISQKQVVIDLALRFLMKYTLKTSDSGAFIDISKTKSTRCPTFLNNIKGIPHYEEEINKPKAELKPKMKMMLKRKDPNPQQTPNIQIVKSTTPIETKERSYEEAKKKIYSSLSPQTPESAKEEKNDLAEEESLKWVENLKLSEEPIKQTENEIEYSDDPIVVVSKTIEGKGINPNAKPFIPACMKKSDLKK